MPSYLYAIAGAVLVGVIYSRNKQWGALLGLIIAVGALYTLYKKKG